MTSRIWFGLASCVQPVHNKVVSGLQTLLQARALKAGLESTKEVADFRRMRPRKCKRCEFTSKVKHEVEAPHNTRFLPSGNLQGKT
ncbi:hypothetical protein PoB_006126800 [Plakobranchus ocellatus]|uniref:Uncharacterized protein n=1 Tax=Plakobranchus ocellatus TaxID=259542 RepID=A0AAV4CSA3_9GAST|nr:hypothetical protein PoB_006126800 [Plakobranchus ocellatus]